MSDFQTKVGGGLNKIQDGLQAGKQKLQIAQEVNQLKRSLQEVGEQRAHLLIQLGEMCYQRLRSQTLVDHDLQQAASEITSADIRMFKIQKTLDELTKPVGSGSTCPTCGNPISINDKFCGGCPA